MVDPMLQRQIITYCVQHMRLSAMVLGASGSQTAMGGNLAMLYASRNGQQVYRKAAYSNLSCLTPTLKSAFTPVTPKTKLGTPGYAPGTQLGNHTEPKLLADFDGWRLTNLTNQPDMVVLASELDCCPNCVKHTVTQLASRSGQGTFVFYVAEINSDRVRVGTDFL